MQRPDTVAWMLAKAVEQLESADKLQRQLLSASQGEQLPTWEPPVDMVASSYGVRLIVALPGVASDCLEVALDESTVVVRGERRFGEGLFAGEIHRLEIPYGRFERHIGLPYGSYRMVDMQLEGGCLKLDLERIS